MMNELVAFYEARLAETEQKARDAIRESAFRESGLGERWVMIRTGFELRELVIQTKSKAFRPHRVVGGLDPLLDEMLAAHIVHHDPERVLADIAADRKLIARYQAAEEGHKEALNALQEARKYGGDEDVYHAAAEDVAAAHARAGAFLTVLEDRAARFSDHPDYQPHWRPA